MHRTQVPFLHRLVPSLVLIFLGGCSALHPAPTASPGAPHPARTAAEPAQKHQPAKPPATKSRHQAPLTNQRQDVLMYTMGLLGTGYRFGGKNPEAGLDCSGMVSFIYREATDYPLRGNAASMAKEGRTVSMGEVRPGDLVFFNTRGFPRSHVGIFIGEGRFVHAPSSNGKIRVDKLDRGYFAQRFEEARTYFD